MGDMVNRPEIDERKELWKKKLDAKHERVRGMTSSFNFSEHED